MKYQIGFLGILLGVFGILVYLTATFNERDLAYFHGSRQDVGAFLDGFRRGHPPLEEINFSSLYSGKESRSKYFFLSPILRSRRRCRSPRRAI